MDSTSYRQTPGLMFGQFYQVTVKVKYILLVRNSKVHLKFGKLPSNGLKCVKIRQLPLENYISDYEYSSQHTHQSAQCFKQITQQLPPPRIITKYTRIHTHESSA